MEMSSQERVFSRRTVPKALELNEIIEGVHRDNAEKLKVPPALGNKRDGEEPRILL